MSTNNVNITPQSLFDAGNDFAAAFPAAATGDVEEGTTAAAAPPAAAAAAAAAADDSDDDEQMGIPPSAPNPRLQELHANLSPNNLLRSQREAKTFENWQYVHTAFVLYTYLNTPQYIDDAFRRHLRDVDATIDYGVITNPPRRYRGPLPIDERKKRHREKILREKISDALGHGGMQALRTTINLRAYTDDPIHYVQYLIAKTEANGKFFVPDHYTQLRSHFNNFCKRHRFTPPQEFVSLLGQYMDGFQRLANKARQSGEGKMHTGSRCMPWEMYRDTTRWFYSLPEGDGIFGAAWSKTTVNMCCRGDSTGQICTKHLVLSDSGDSFGIAACHAKDSQTGTDPVKLIPRDCFCNPLDFFADWASSVFHYLVLNPYVLRDVDGPLFPGDRKSQAQKYSRALKKILDLYVNEDDQPLCLTKYGVDPKHITLYSLRKGAHTRLNCGSTAAPSSAACLLREGHSLGGVRSHYIEIERASNQYAGRIVAGLDVNSAEFAASFPDFIPVDPETCLTQPLSDRAYQAKKNQVDKEVMEVLNELFGREYLRRFPAIHRFLRIGLASHLIHLDTIEELLPERCALRNTALFTNPAVQELRKYVKIAFPWDNHYKYYADASGLPPHVLIMAEFKKQGKKIDALVPKIEEMLESHQMTGTVSVSQIRRIVESSPTIRNMSTVLAEVSARLQDQQRFSNAAAADEDNSMGRVGDQFDMFDHPDGHRRHFPPGYTLQNCKLQFIYQLWHCGDGTQRICPIKDFTPRDRSVWSRRMNKSYSELKSLMESIDHAARNNNVATRARMTRADAQNCFLAGYSEINVKTTTPSGKVRDIAQLKWQSALRYRQKKV